MAKFSITGIESGASDGPFITPVEGEYLLPFGITPQDVLTKHRAALDGITPEEPSAAMQGGNYFQAGALEWFNEEFGADVVEPTDGRRNEHCNLVASLDGIFAEDWQYEGQTIAAGNLWECKIPRRPAERPDTMDRVIQVQAQMDSTDCEFAVIAELARSDLKWRIAVVPRHHQTIVAVRKAVDVFWRHMADGTDYPPVTSREASRMIAGNRGLEPMDLTEGPTETIMGEARQHMIDAADTYMAAKRARDSSDRMMEDCALTMKHSMAGVERVILPGGVRVNHTTVEYKAQPEKVKTTPAKAAHTSRRFKVEGEIE